MGTRIISSVQTNWKINSEPTTSLYNKIELCQMNRETFKLLLLSGFWICLIKSRPHKIKLRPETEPAYKQLLYTFYFYTIRYIKNYISKS